MDYPLEDEELTAGASRLLSGDDLCAGRVPGFEIADALRIGPAAQRIGERKDHVLDVEALEVYTLENVDALLDHRVGEEFVRATAEKLLVGAEEAERIIVATWDFHELVRDLGTPRAVMFPWWRRVSRALPRLPVPVRASRGVGDDQVVWIHGGDGRFVRNDKAGATCRGSRSTIRLPSEVWRLTSARPRFTRITLEDPALITP